MKDNITHLIPPQALDFEAVVLGALLLERDAYGEISDIIDEKSFYNIRHKKIFKAIKALMMASNPVDIITVTNELRKRNELESIGGPYYITELTSRLSSGANITYHASIIQQKYIERESIRLANEFVRDIYNGTHDIFLLKDHFVNSAQKLTESTSGLIPELCDLINERLAYYETNAGHGLTGITSGFKKIDKITSGWQRSNLVILAARPSMGKTAFMLNLARNAAVEGRQSVAIFSLEMSKRQLIDRIISAETSIPLDNIINRNLQPCHFKEMHNMHDLIDCSILIDDTASLSLQSFRSKCAKLKRDKGIGLIVIDYLQLMRGESEYKNNREQEISSISRGLKAVAKDLDVAIIALSQLSRKVEERADKRPMLSDLRESGSIEQDADQVIFLFRPEYYGISVDFEGNSMEGMTEAIFAKNRNGALETTILKFNGAKMKFSELE